MPVERCPYCDIPTPECEGTLHHEDCPDHDETSCLACKEIEHGDGVVT